MARCARHRADARRRIAGRGVRARLARVNRVILCHILGIAFSRLWSFRQAPATLNLIEGADSARLEVVRLNDCSHHTTLFGEAVHRAL